MKQFSDDLWGYLQLQHSDVYLDKPPVSDSGTESLVRVGKKKQLGDHIWSNHIAFFMDVNVFKSCVKSELLQVVMLGSSGFMETVFLQCLDQYKPSEL
jgi:hypothetical protein